MLYFSKSCIVNTSSKAYTIDAIFKQPNQNLAGVMFEISRHYACISVNRKKTHKAKVVLYITMRRTCIFYPSTLISIANYPDCVRRFVFQGSALAPLLASFAARIFKAHLNDA